MLRPHGLLEASIYGPDLDALRRFYTSLFGFPVIVDSPGRMVALRCGTTALLLFDPEVTQQGGLHPPHGTTGPGHVAFVIGDDELDDWRAQLAAHGVAIEKEISWQEGGTSIYFRDPAGNSVELAPPTIWGGLGRQQMNARLRE